MIRHPQFLPNVSSDDVWFDNHLYVDFVSNSKNGVVLFQLEYPNSNISYMCWRLTDGLRVARLTPSSNATHFSIEDTLDDTNIHDMMFGTRDFDLVLLSPIGLDINMSRFRGNRPFNFTMHIHSTYWTDVQFVPYINYVWNYDESASIRFGDLGMGPWHFWEHLSWRWETGHPALFACMLLCYVLVAILLISLSSQQPLNSRGIIPFLANFILFLILLGGLRNYLNPDDRGRMDCWYSATVNFPLSVSAGFCGFLSYFRYTIMRLINKRKESVIRNKVTYEKHSNFLMRFFTVSQRWYVQLGVFILFATLTMILYVVVEVAVREEDFMICTHQRWVLIAIMILVVSATYTNLPIDIYLSWEHVKKCHLKELFWSDPLAFKFELYILYPMGLLCVALTQSLISEVNSGEWWKIVLWSGVFHFIWFAEVLHPLLRTILGMIMGRCRKKVNTNVVIDILADRRGLELFYEQAKREYSAENISCYEDIVAYEQIENEEERIHNGMKLVSLYFSGRSCELEINCSSDQLEELHRRVEKNDFAPDLFESIKETVLINISDTFSRLVVTSEFLKYRKETEFLQNWEMRPKAKPYLKKNVQSEMKETLL